MALTFREQIEATAWELGNGEGTMPELRKRFDADPETPNFDPAKALEMLHILQLINYKQAGKGRGRARCHYLKKTRIRTAHLRRAETDTQGRARTGDPHPMGQGLPRHRRLARHKLPHDGGLTHGRTD